MSASSASVVCAPVHVAEGRLPLLQGLPLWLWKTLQINQVISSGHYDRSFYTLLVVVTIALGQGFMTSDFTVASGYVIFCCLKFCTTQEELMSSEYTYPNISARCRLCYIISIFVACHFELLPRQCVASRALHWFNQPSHQVLCLWDE